MKALLRFVWRTVSVIAHVSTWVVTLTAFALIVVMTVLLTTGTRPIVVTSGSMEPIIPVGSIVLAHKVEGSQIKVGDVVTVPLSPTKNVTHRVIETKDKNGLTELRMKGDANETPDPAPYTIKSAWRLETVMPAVGKLLLQARSPIGLMALGVLFGSSILTFASRVGNLRNRREEEDVTTVVEDVTPANAVTVTVPNLVIAAEPSGDLMSSAEVDIRTEELERQKDVLITAVNHELRTPLTSIMGYLELLTEGDFGEVNEVQQNALLAVKRNADRLHGLVGNLLTAAQIEGGQLHPSLGVVVEAEGILQGVHDNFEKIARDRAIDFNLMIDSELGHVQGSAEQIKTCVDHLVSNAIKFTPEDGRVTIRAFNDAGYLNVSVSDTGVGIEPHYIPDLFDNFFRTPEADRDASAGSGLGLAIVQAIVTAYEGVITVDSVPGIGSTFTIKMPTIERANALAADK